MPTTESHTDIYQEYLSVIDKLINSHSHGPTVIAGDFNAQVGPPGGKLLMELLDCNDLYFTSLNSCARGPCFDWHHLPCIQR